MSTRALTCAFCFSIMKQWGQLGLLWHQRAEAEHACVCVMRILLAIAICAAWLQSSALADYYDPPPDWSTKPHFTHQQWEFSTSANPAQAEPGYTNAAGAPSVQIGGDAFWIDDPSAYVATDRRGMWVVGGFTAPTTATQVFLIPNDSALTQKYVWLQFTYFLTGAPGATYNTELTTDGGETVSVIAGSEVSYPVDSETNWFYYEKMWDITPPPSSETITANINLPANALFALDEAAIDTVSIPEPLALCLLAVGGVVYRRATHSELGNHDQQGGNHAVDFTANVRRCL